MSESAVESEENSFSKSEPPLPQAPRARRWIALGSLTLVGLGAWMCTLALTSRAEFALETGAPHDLGALATAELEDAPAWVRATGTPGINALSFERMGSSGSFRLAPTRERPEVWVLLRVPENMSAQGYAYVPPSRFVGRLTPLKDAGLFLKPVKDLIGDYSGGKEAEYVLLDGESPHTHRPSLVAALLLALLGTACLSFAVVLCRAPVNPRPTF